MYYGYCGIGVRWRLGVIGLCYILGRCVSCSGEVFVQYSPGFAGRFVFVGLVRGWWWPWAGDFSLLDFLYE